MKKRLFFLLIVLLMVFVAGCGDKNNSKGKGKNRELTRGEWIACLSESFGFLDSDTANAYFTDVDANYPYFASIQACGDWGVLDTSQQKLEVDKKATIGFAVDTAVKSMGIDKLREVYPDDKLDTEEDSFTFFCKYITVVNDKDTVLDEKKALLIREQAEKFWNAIPSIPVEDIQYTEGTVTLPEGSLELHTDGKTAVLAQQGLAVAGNTVILNPTPELPSGFAGKVTSVAEDGVTITYEEAELEDVFTSFHLSGDYSPDWITVTPASDDVTLEGTDTSSYQMSSKGRKLVARQVDCKISKANKGIAVNVSKSVDGASINGTFAISNISVSPDMDVNIFPFNVKSLSVKVSLTPSVNIDITGDLSSGAIPLGKMTIPLGTSPFTADIDLSLKIDAHGEAHLAYSCTDIVRAEYRKGAKAKASLSTADSSCKIDAKVNIAVNAQARLTLTALKMKIIDAGVITGANASIASDILGGCTDLHIYVPLQLFIGHSGLASKIGLTKDIVIWGEKNSKFDWKYHIEDGKIVDKCTKSDKKEEKTESDFDKLLKKMKGLKEYLDKSKITPIEYEGFIELSTGYASMKEGGSQTLTVTKLPNGYNASDIVYESNNTNVITVDANGTITAVSSGTASVIVKTADKKHVAVCLIHVLGNYNVDFNGLPEA